MSIEHLPFSSFALESSASPTPGLVDAWTLTLASGPTTHPLLDMAMGGTIALNVDGALATSGQSARVVPVGSGAVTVTF